MKLGPIADQLKGGPLVRVAGALEFAQLAGKAGVLPAAFVVPARKVAADNTLGTAAIDQKVTDEFLVLIQLDGGRRAEDAISEQIDELETFVIGRLLGWKMPGASRPTTYAGSDLVRADLSLITWGVRFRSSHHLRKTS